MGIKVTDGKSKTPETLKLASKISSYLFEQRYGEIEKYMKDSEIKAIEKCRDILFKVSNRSKK